VLGVAQHWLYEIQRQASSGLFGLRSTLVDASSSQPPNIDELY
jgi:hypothetical protein